MTNTAFEGMRRHASALSVVIMSLTIPVASYADDTNLVQNGSFEECTDPAEYILNVPVGYTNITGWTVIQGPLDYCSWPAADGIKSLDLGGTPGAGGIQQTIPTTAGSIYNLSFYMSGNPEHNFDPSLKTMRVQVDGESQNFSYDTLAMGNSGADMKWQRHSIQFVASSDTTSLSFLNTMGVVYEGPALDNVAVTPAAQPQVTTSVNMYAGIMVDGPLGSTNKIQYVNNLTDTNWITLDTIILSNNPTLYFDTNSTFFSHRFYRVELQ
jgi:choice-of-anchor C domain-containing protein